ncbi:MAG: ATP-binding cassette domain-containing protein [Candidatus Methanoperedenaceae archaeon]|nr:ATP-binding cassette domain-containing protein [Candidatus Methanoperedenaceae archaeon]
MVGIIGRNGAGKSTLLKILSRITEPTEGKITMRGRVASLLEVGTGFHPELKGGENIYLNGSILGMKKRYSAGCMNAQSRASGGRTLVCCGIRGLAHLEPEILLVDEVLAVGMRGLIRSAWGRVVQKVFMDTVR